MGSHLHTVAVLDRDKLENNYFKSQQNELAFYQGPGTATKHCNSYLHFDNSYICQDHLKNIQIQLE